MRTNESKVYEDFCYRGARPRLERLFLSTLFLITNLEYQKMNGTNHPKGRIGGEHFWWFR